MLIELLATSFIDEMFKIKSKYFDYIPKMLFFHLTSSSDEFTMKKNRWVKLITGLNKSR